MVNKLVLSFAAACIATTLLLAGVSLAGWPGSGKTYPIVSGTIGGYTLLGSNIASRNGLNTITLTTVAAIPGGAGVVVCTGNVDGNHAISSISDGTNSYTKGGGGVTANGITGSEIWYKQNASAVSSGATLTVTGSANFDTNAVFVIAAYVTSLAVTPVDNHPAPGNNTNTISTGVLAQASELVIGTFVGYQAANPTYNESAGFTNIAAVSLSAANYVAGGCGYKITNATTSVTYNPSFTNAATNSAIDVVSFKGP